MRLLEKIGDFAGLLLEHEIRTNIGWLFFGRVFYMGVGFLVNIFVARYLGPSQLGILSYALSLKSFLGAFVYLGLGGLVVRELVKSPEEEGLILGTTFSLRFAGGLIGFAIIMIFAAISSSERVERFVLVIIGLSLLFNAFDCIDFWFQSQIMAKYTVVGRNIAFSIISFLKILLILLHKDIYLFAIVYSLEFFLYAVIIIMFYINHGGDIKKWSFSLTKALELLNNSWIMIISGFFALIYLKIDQIMLRIMVGTQEVGVYSVAVQISEVWYFIPTSIATSVFPRLINLRKEDSILYRKSLQQIFDSFFVVSVIVAVFCQLFAGMIIPFLYGKAFQATAAVLQIHIWAGIFMFQRALLSKWFLIEDALRFSLYGTGLGALFNVLLNLLLIPSMHGRGAAIATLISYAMSSYLFLFFWSETRPVARMMSKAFLLPLRVFVTKRSNINDE